MEVQLMWQWILDNFEVSGGNPNRNYVEIVSDEIYGGFSVSMM
jgi:hypothetical protein